jgi:hypothetical protein
MVAAEIRTVSGKRTFLQTSSVNKPAVNKPACTFRHFIHPFEAQAGLHERLNQIGDDCTAQNGIAAGERRLKSFPTHFSSFGSP